MSGDTLRALGAGNLRDALSLAAGVDVAPGGDAGPAGSVPEFWGLREFDAFLLVVDDVPLGGAFNPALTALSLQDVERVEVLRGSAPVTYGATSFVGAIHVVHNSAAADRKYLSAQWGAFATGLAAVDLSMPAPESWKARLTVDAERRGFSDERTSFARGHANYRMSRTAGQNKLWFSGDLTWLAQQPASPHVREGAALSSATPLDANYNPAGAFLDETRLPVLRDRPAAQHDARWTALVSPSHSAQRMFSGFLTTSRTREQRNRLPGEHRPAGLYADTHVVWTGAGRIQIVAGGDWTVRQRRRPGRDVLYTVPLERITATPSPRRPR